MSPGSDPIKRLRRLHESGQHNDVVQMIRDRESVLERYGPLFRAPESLDEETFAGFLRFESNRHWWNLHHDEAVLRRHFEVVRDVLVELVDEDRAIADRIDGIGDVAGLEPRLYTAILLVAHPDRYGVWSEISEAALRRLELWPEGADHGSEGERYERINEMLGLVSTDVGVDLWTLDALLWGVEKEHDPTAHFVRRRARPAAPTTRSPRSRKAKKPAASRKKAVQPEMFVCTVCFTSKPVRLASDTPGVCIDCA